MPEPSTPDWRPSLISALVYRDPKAALSFLEAAFGFELFMLIEDDQGNLAHSEMRFGEAAIMIGSEWSDDHKSPSSLGGKVTQSVHIRLETDINAHCERARAAGMEILAEPQQQFYGDASYRCRDPEGHIWTVSQTVRTVSREEAEAASGLKITGWV
ncbi:MAG: VOC family protein [Phenylobacterium sp.]|nr:VOC family protein [Phenylobacterium sp.]